MRALPQPLPDPPKVPEPSDIPYRGIIELFVDASDVRRAIYRVREVIPVARTGPMTLVYPEWLPGYHSPQAPIELFAGLVISGNGQPLSWRRDPVNVYAFHLDVPADVSALEVSFEYLSPTNEKQERVTVTTALLSLQWNTVILHPAGHYARQIQVKPTIKLPLAWQFASALEIETSDATTTTFQTVPLDTLIDSPLMAGRNFRQISLASDVRLNIVADSPDLLNASEEQIALHRNLIVQADLLFGARHFDHYDFLLALSEEAGEIGVEHHRSCESITLPGYFTDWEGMATRHGGLAHEYVHSWNGKFRRGADSWQPCFLKPIRNSLMWVYEGLTQYYGQVLGTRAGLQTKGQLLGSLAETAARYDARRGRLWRSLSDTTRDPIIAGRAALPWPSWQRSEDYYSEGALIWLDVDTRIREMSGEQKSLDDFARAFFGMRDGDWITDTYEMTDVLAALQAIAPYDWQSYFHEKLYVCSPDAPLDGLARGGYELVYRDGPNEYSRRESELSGSVDLSFSVGLVLGTKGTIQEVLWESAAYKAGLTAGDAILAVAGQEYSAARLKEAVGSDAKQLELVVKHNKRVGTVTVACEDGHRYPHLAERSGERRLDQILSPI